MRFQHKDHGLTLIELVVAMAVFALVAVMGLQSLTGTLRLRDRVDGLASQSAELGQAVRLLRNDMDAIVPLLFFPPGGNAPRSALRQVSGGQGVEMSVAGQPVPAGQAGAGMQRVIWQLSAQDGVLRRQVYATLYPASDAARLPQTEALGGVTALTMRSYWPDVGWIDGLRPAGGVIAPDAGGPAADSDNVGVAAEIYSDTLPLALEITLETRDHGPVTLLESLQ